MKIEDLRAKAKDLISRGYLVAFVASFLFFFPAARKSLLSESLDLDEMIAWKWLNESWSDLWRHLLGDAQGPVYVLFMKLVHTLFPLENDYWVRAPSLAIATGIFFLWSFRWSRRYSDKPVILILLMLLLAFNPLFRFVAAYARYSVLLLALCSYLTVRISDQLENGKTMVLNKWDILAIGTLACTHFLGILWLGTCMVATLIMKVKIQLGKNPVLKMGFILISVALQAFFFLHQASMGKDLSWTVNFHEQIRTLLEGVFGDSYFIWIPLILLHIVVLRGRLSFAYQFFLLQIALILMANCLGLLVHVNLFIFRFCILFTPMVFILLEETFVWLSDSVTRNTIGQSLLQLTVVFLTLDPRTQHFSGKSGPKQILIRLKNEIADSKTADSNRVGCVIGKDFFHILDIYSQQYFKKDVCSVYWDSFNQPGLEKMRYLLVYDSDRSNPSVSSDWIKKEESEDHGWMLFEKAEL